MTDTGLFTVRDILFRGNQDPDHHAIECPGYQPLTYRDLRLQILTVVKNLNARGLHRNDRIAIITPPGPETAVIIISVMAGFTAVPLNTLYKTQEYENFFSHLGLKALIVQDGCDTSATEAAASRDIPVITLIPAGGRAGEFMLEPALKRDFATAEFAVPSDVSNVLLTSGTTATPKIVSNTQKKLCLSRYQQIIPLKITNTDRCLHIVPYYHGMGLGLPLLSILLAGGTVICTKDFIPSDFISLLKTYRPTCYTAGPALHQAILREIRKIPPGELKKNSLRFILSGSMSLHPDVRNELETLLEVPVIEHYASSETGTISINFPPKCGSVGIPVIESLCILNENDKSLGPCEQGEIVVKGDTVFNEYEGSPDETKSAFIDGWCRTGDIGYLDDEGYLFITGRKKELINKGGEKISPTEIDCVLQSHPGVREAMAFLVHDPVLGEDIAAMVVPANAEVTENELRRYLLDRLVQFKIPRRIYFVDEIPRNPAGKPLRHAGTERYS